MKILKKLVTISGTGSKHFDNFFANLGMYPAFGHVKDLYQRPFETVVSWKYVHPTGTYGDFFKKWIFWKILKI